MNSNEIMKSLKGRRRVGMAMAKRMLITFAKENGLHDWEFHIIDIPGYSNKNANRENALYGACFPRQKTIVVTPYAVKNRTPRQLRDHILHEIAHALVPDEDHSDKWEKKALEIGCTLGHLIGSRMARAALAQSSTVR